MRQLSPRPPCERRHLRAGLGAAVGARPKGSGACGSIFLPLLSVWLKSSVAVMVWEQGQQVEQTQ